MLMQRHWDIFCRVIDNYGDAGICWRLAVELSNRGEQVCLYVDQPDVLKQLTGNQSPESLSVSVWPDDNYVPEASMVADIVIEAFACDPPAGYILAMVERAQSGNAPVWINLEYLSAEDWVSDYHRAASPHPRHPLTKHFYFPGFTPESGGLIRESWISETQVFPHTFEASTPLKIFLFSYQQAQLPEWLRVLRISPEKTQLGIASCPVVNQIRIQEETVNKEGYSLRLEYLPFVAQRDFDALLAQYDLLFVRGEDSFVRAQWAGKPLIWQIYPQEDQAHLGKLQAFYARYLNATLLTFEDRPQFMHFVMAWNGFDEGHSCAQIWPTIRRILPSLQKNALAWREHLLTQEDLVSQLQAFVDDLVKWPV